MKVIKYLSPEAESAGGGSSTETEKLSGFDLLSETSFLQEENIQKEEIKDQIEETEKEEEAKPFEVENDKENNDEQKKVETEKKNDETSTKKEEEESETFKIEEEQNKEEESTWVGLAKELEIAGVEKDDYDVFKEKLQEKLNSKYEEGNKFAFEDFKSKQTPETQFMLDALMTGATIEEITKPTQEIEKLLSLSNYELVKTDLEAQEGWTEQMVLTELDRLTSNNLVDHEAEKIQAYLNSEKGKIQKAWTDKIKSYHEESGRRKADTLEKEAKVIEQVVQNVNEFMDTPLTSKVKDYLMRNFRNGKYEQALKDPNVIADFMMFMEFKKQAISNLRNKSYEKGRLEAKKGLHNIPPSGGETITGKTHFRSGDSNGAGNWELLQEEFN